MKQKHTKEIGDRMIYFRLLSVEFLVGGPRSENSISDQTLIGSGTAHMLGRCVAVEAEESDHGPRSGGRGLTNGSYDRHSRNRINQMLQAARVHVRGTGTGRMMS